MRGWESGLIERRGNSLVAGGSPTVLNIGNRIK